MRVIDVGSGAPIVVVPGAQGRWEWQKPGVDALAERCRVLTFSLSDEPSCGGVFDENAGFDCYVEQVRDVLDRAGLQKAAICGVSYGGLIAATFAARYPERTEALVLVSAIPPTWTPNARIRFYTRAPRLLAPLFWVRSPLAMYPEIAAALPNLAERVRLMLTHGWRVVTNPTAPTRMARRVRLLERRISGDSLTDLRVPTLLVTGEAALERIVPPQLTREYQRYLPHARLVTLERTGHIGIVTRPRELAQVIVSFLEEHVGAQVSDRRHIG
jgi:pimeloyl-ACP methyl ester carboxylesterase